MQLDSPDSKEISSVQNVILLKDLRKGGASKAYDWLCYWSRRFKSSSLSMADKTPDLDNPSLTQKPFEC